MVYFFFCIGIKITQGPSNVTAYVGDSVTLPCIYTGTTDQPYWRIGRIIHSPSNLPAGYEYTNEGLYISSVWAQLNNTVHICFFTIHIGEGMFTNIESQPAFITVRIRCKSIITTSVDMIVMTLAKVAHLVQYTPCHLTIIHSV